MAKTPVFLSWSGDYAKEVASALKEFLGDVLNGLEVFHSNEDIQAGTKWGDVIGRRLRDAKVGVICITKDKLDSRWINYEAGAIVNAVGDEKKVIPYCIDLEVGGLGSPLGVLNGVKAGEKGTRDLVASINEECGDGKTEKEKVDRLFEACFPKFWRKFEAATAEEARRRDKPVKVHEPTSLEMFQSIEEKLLAWVSGPVTSMARDIARIKRVLDVPVARFTKKASNPRVGKSEVRPTLKTRFSTIRKTLEAKTMADEVDFGDAEETDRVGPDDDSE